MRQISEIAQRDNVVEEFGCKREQRHGWLQESGGASESIFKKIRAAMKCLHTLIVMPLARGRKLMMKRTQ